MLVIKHNRREVKKKLLSRDRVSHCHTSKSFSSNQVLKTLEYIVVSFLSNMFLHELNFYALP